MKVVISVNREKEEIVVTLQDPTNREIHIFSDIIAEYSSNMDSSIEVQIFHTPREWYFLSYTADKLDVLSNELADVLNSGFGREVVEIDSNSSKTINRSR